ncbi:MAG: hypothetical protein EP330_30810 [Deltaproteobacteria bacterium]|nr:MAG: hypothetical protein EP330_30810 [Deltaproteobacteria bacterium]
MVRIAFLGMFLTSSAFAADPVVSSSADGTVKGSVVLNVSPAEAMAALENPELARTINPDVVALQQLATTGDCTDLDISTRGMWRPLKMKARRCKTATGFHETLLESDDFTVQEATWTVSEHPDGALLEYTLKSEPNLPVPRSLVQDNMRRSVKEMLGRFVRNVLK